MSDKLLSLTQYIRMTRLAIGALVFLTLSACFLDQDTDQIHGMVDLNFSSTAVCNSQQKLVQFSNDENVPLIIEGAAISGGTDPEGNFTLTSVKVGNTTTPAITGILNDVEVPARAFYSFLVTYNPRSENKTHSAVLDIALREPKQGVIQVALEGDSTSRAVDCPSGGGSVDQGVGTLNGNLTLTIDRIALVSNSLAQPISTDPNNTKVPFESPELTIIFNAAGNSVTLPAILDSANFILPPTLTPPLGGPSDGDGLIPGFTHVTSVSDVTGTYGDDGSLQVNNVAIHLKEKFEADFVVSLTTGEVGRDILSANLLNLAGFSLSNDQTKLLGSKISPDDLKVVLVGVSRFTNGKNAPGQISDVSRSITGAKGAVVIEATVNQ